MKYKRHGTGWGALAMAVIETALEDASGTGAKISGQYSREYIKNIATDAKRFLSSEDIELFKDAAKLLGCVKKHPCVKETDYDTEENE